MEIKGSYTNTLEYKARKELCDNLGDKGLNKSKMMKERRDKVAKMKRERRERHLLGIKDLQKQLMKE